MQLTLYLAMMAMKMSEQLPMAGRSESGMDVAFCVVGEHAAPTAKAQPADSALMSIWSTVNAAT